MIKLYGITRSRTYRCLWMLEELGLPYERELIATGEGGARSPAYLAINPNARIPTLDDDGTILWESMAINLYLAEKYSQELWPADVAGHARCYQWSHWVMMEMEAHALHALRHQMLLPEAERDPSEWQQSVDALQRPLGVLDGALADRPCLLGEAFTVADLNVAAVMTWVYRARVPLDAYPHVADWLGRCMQRPALQRVNEGMRAAS